MEIPGLGAMEIDDDSGSLIGGPVAIPALGGAMCELVLEECMDDPAPEDFHVAMRNFLSMTPEVLKAAESDLYLYYQDCNSYWSESDEEYVAIATPGDVWNHIQFGFEAIASREGKDDTIYISLTCNCDWEPEHGLQLVFRNGLRINKLGPYDGHHTNSGADAKDGLDEVVYRQRPRT